MPDGYELVIEKRGGLAIGSPATLYRYIPAARTANTPGV